ncbi:MAG: AAA family ATPase [Candidatus Eremiobacteraeota bacterium]|nr:AAA family ATPase [Candidatus Eremiobacteraeota bacterium]
MGKTAGHLDIRLFGHLEVALDGARFKLATPRKSLQVLAYLLLHRDVPVSREYLAFLLYPDDEEGAARTKLRATLSELPKILPSPSTRYVSIDTEKVAWNPESGIWLDVAAFDAAAADRSRLAEAIDLYRGDLLPEIYDEWLEIIRERYRNIYLRALTDFVSEARRNANLPLALETARKVLAVDPWREDIVRRIIAMRYAGGDRAGALREYADFAKRLHAEIGADPMPETAAVAERISRDQAPDDGEPADEFRAPANGSALLPFVGRRDEMERMLEAWSRAARGRGACVFVGGEAGIGKSRLVLEFAHAVEERGGRVLTGATSSPETVPYESVVDAFRSALPLVAALKPGMALACVAALLPELYGRVTLQDVPALDADRERMRLFESLFRCVADLAAPRPLLMILEDVHWAEAASLDLLQFLFRRIAGVPVMIVATYRDEESTRLAAFHRVRREARASAGAQTVWLDRLSATDVAELGAMVSQADDGSADLLATASRGNPLFLTQLVVEVREGRPAAVPVSLEAALAQRVERLSEHARTAAQIAACIGDRFSRDAVREVSAWEEAEITEALDELLDRRIVREAGGRGFLEYAFTHQLVQASVARTVPPQHAAVRRRRIARVLERLYPERVPELSASLAAHYEAGGDIQNATRCYLQAVRRSISIGAVKEARAQCDRALAIAADLRDRAQLLLESVAIETRAGDRDSQHAAIEALEQVDGELGDLEIHRATLLHRMEYASTNGDRAMHERAASALRTCLPEGDARATAALHQAESKMSYAGGRLSDAYASAQAALAASRSAGDEAGTTRALCSLAQVEAYRGNLTHADALFDEAARVAGRAADPVLEYLALSSGWNIAYQRRDLRRCLALCSRALEVAVAIGDRQAEAQAHGRMGIVLGLIGGRWRESREHFGEALRMYTETGNLAGSGGTLINQAVVEFRLGSFDRALMATERAIELFASANDLRGRITGLSNLALQRGWTGDIAGAREAGEAALELARRLEFKLAEPSTLENLSVAEAVAGNYERAIELAQSSLAMRSSSGTQVWTAKTLADLAIWHAALGDMAAARDAVTRLLENEEAIVTGSDWPWYCYWAAAQIFHLDGDDAQASRTLLRARKLMEQMADGLEPEDRERFMAIRWNVDLSNAVAAGAWPTPPR